MFVELHARSAFSFLEGASVPEELAGWCAQLDLPAMAILDRDGVYGAPRFHLAAKKLGLRALIGAEVTLSPRPFDSSTIRQFDHGLTRLPLLVESRAGYQNLCRLITRMKMRSPKVPKKGQEPAVTAEELSQHAAGLLCLTGDERGPLAQALEQGGVQKGRRSVEGLMEIFGRGNVYIELQRHGQRAQEARNHGAVEIARALRLPLLASNGACYAQPAQSQVLDVLTCVRHHCQLETAGRLLERNRERYLKGAGEMARRFADLPEAVANTGELASRLGFTLADLGYQFPCYPVPEGESMMSFLRQRTAEGARSRYVRAPCAPHLWPRAQRQLERELALIEKLGLAGYFLIVWDIVRWCRQQGILAQGRGSAANSAVCYALGITAVDPIAMDLLFERFLSEERGEWPDIDLDLPSGEQRERVIQYVYQRYGKLGAAMTANVITYRGRSAAREVGKALGFDPQTLDRLSKVVGAWEFHDPKDTLDRQFRDAGLDLRHPRLRKFLELCLRIQDLPRHLGQHSGGMVICQGQLDSVVPLEPATMPGRVVVQWDKDDCADLGLIKVDLLGLGMMAVLEDSLALIRQHYGEDASLDPNPPKAGARWGPPYDLDPNPPKTGARWGPPYDLGHLPPDDPEVYAALQRADTVGMFQIESRAQMSCLPRLRPQKFYDIVVQVAIIRPGPIVGKMVNPYLQRRQGREAVSYPHPLLQPVLERTLGVPLFQEQLLRMAMIAAGFSGGEAEELRRAFGFKRSPARMQEIEVKLRRGMEKNGIPRSAQEMIVDAITSFALYGFPESHAASFALLAYASAYLKCHYLAAFTAALLNNQPMGFYHPSTIVKDAQRHGLKIRPVDVNRSQWPCTLEPVTSSQFPVLSSQKVPEQLGTENRELRTALRLGLRYVKGLREEAARALLEERQAGPFHSVEDLARRVPDLRKNELRMLAEIGALNFLGRSSCSHRRDALWHVERAARPAGPLLERCAQPEETSPLAPMNAEERLVADFHGAGLTLGPHPMAYHRARMQQIGVRAACELARLPNGRGVRIAGSVIARQRPGTANGFVFLSLEDETGIANAIVTPDLFEQHRFLLVSARFLLVEGELQNLDNVISVKARRVLPLEVSRAETQSHDFH